MDRPLKGSVQGLSKAKKLFLPCFFFDFLSNISEKLRPPLICNEHCPLFGGFPMFCRLVFLDVNPNKRNKPCQIVLQANIGKTAISGFLLYIWNYSGHTKSKIWKSRADKTSVHGPRKNLGISHYTQIRHSGLVFDQRF